MAKALRNATTTGTSTQTGSSSKVKRKAPMAAKQTALYPSKIDFSDATRGKLVDLCNQHLADTSDLVSQIKQAHWNVKGSDFQQLHELFDAIYAEIEPFVDEVAERVTTLGGVARGTVRMAADASTLPEYPDDIAAGKAHLEAVRDRVAAYAAATRQAIAAAGKLEDPTTEDLFTALSRTVDLQLYFLEAHLQG
ncbi:MAG TPA: DNA starvation/stationary phase protection protein Dps [Trueperaceae bacterium]|nr:DNA starvation/stationary phase protection protein Dps [Trueperaceae bacterium]